MIFGAIFASCSLFDTREPEDPDTTTGPSFIQPDRPESVIENLTNAVRHMNADHYRRSLSGDEFEYEPSTVAQSSSPATWTTWGFDQEQIYFSNMRADAEGRSGHNLQFDNESRGNVGENEEQYEADYTLTIRHNRSGLPEVAQGRIILTMVQAEDGQWSIRSWVDSGDGSDFTWSDFRAAFLD